MHISIRTGGSSEQGGQEGAKGGKAMNEKGFKRRVAEEQEA